MSYKQGNCSALLTREGFFDFVIFRTRCNVSHHVALVCQHEEKSDPVFNNDMSDVKVFQVGGFYSSHVYSSCDDGWFMVDNTCINIYPCKNCQTNTEAREQCGDHGGYLAHRNLNKVTVTTPGNILASKTELSSFWSMLHHAEDISAPMSSPDLVVHDKRMNLAVNGSGLCGDNSGRFRDLCESLRLSNSCDDSNIVLSVTNKFHESHYMTITDADDRKFDLYYSFLLYDANLLWSVISQPSFQVEEDKHFALCEKPFISKKIISNCSDFYVTCDDGTCVHDSLVCDGQPHCLHAEDEADCQHICSDHKDNCLSHCHRRDLCSCSAGYFQCLSGGCVPLQKLCDKTVHCADASDEPPTCVYQRPEAN